jgi:hypothetical protein
MATQKNLQLGAAWPVKAWDNGDGSINTLPAISVGTCTKVAVSGSSAQSGAITAAVVRLVSSTDCHVKFGSNPTAVADGTSLFLPAGVPEYFQFGSGDKIAVIQDSTSGNLFITAAA